MRRWRLPAGAGGAGLDEASGHLGPVGLLVSQIRGSPGGGAGPDGGWVPPLQKPVGVAGAGRSGPGEDGTGDRTVAQSHEPSSYGRAIRQLLF